MAGVPGTPNKSPHAMVAGLQEELVADSVRKLAARVAQLGLAEVPDSVVQELFELPPEDAAKCMQGVWAPQLRNPVALLKWKLRALREKAAAVSEPTAAASVLSAPRAPVLPALPATPVPETARTPLRLTDSPPEQVQQDTSPCKRARDSLSPASGEHSALQRSATAPLHCCPGCGQPGPAQSTASHTPHGVMEAMWGRHSCGASWMLTSVGPSFRGSGLLSVWLQELTAPRLQEPCGLVAHENTPAVLPRCTACGSMCELLMMLRTDDPNKVVVQLSCSPCGLLFWGSRHQEGVWFHYCVAGSHAPRVQDLACFAATRA